MAQLLITAVALVCLVSSVCGGRDEPSATPRAGTAMEQNGAGEASLVAQLTTVSGVPQQKLRICNGYVGDKLWVTRLPGQLITQAPLAFKECRDFDLALREADKIDFRVGGISIGVFTAKGVPKVAKCLLLVVHARGGRHHSALFQSHAYMDLRAAQVAVIDAYRGPATGHLELADWRLPAAMPATRAATPASAALAQAAQQSEVLQYNSVIAVNPGKYACSLVGDGGGKGQPMKLEARASEHYVMMRVGGPQGRPEELVLFGSAVPLRVLLVVVLAVVVSLAQGL